MPAPQQIVRIFISSPGDVADERDKSRRVIESLQRRYAGIQLVPVLWEELALPATASFQESIDFLLNDQAIDVAVFILWSRLGSPLGAATSRPDGTPYRSGTEREFDLMLAAFEQSDRKRPVILAYTRDDDSGFRHALTDCPSDKLEDMIKQRKLVDAFIREQFFDEKGRNLRAVRSYREPVSFAQQLHMHLRQVLDNLLSADEAPRWLDEPYRGLKAFGMEHAAIFHGRDEETADLLQRLRDQQRDGCAFVVIVGASGSGKSSLARAGVAASLLEHSFDDGVKDWKVVPIVPGLSGGDVCLSLAQGLAKAFPELSTAPEWVELMAESLANRPGVTLNLSILPTLKARDTTEGGTTKVLFLLDQLEELWTDPRITTSHRDQFFAAVEVLAECPEFAVLATLRSDFYPQAQLSASFLRMKAGRGHFDLIPPGPSSLQRLIVEPAQLAGLRFERDDRSGRVLDEILLQDASEDPKALPLLEYTLAELYAARDDKNRLLTISAYDALGRVDGAIGKRAAAIIESMSENARAALPEILPQLVSVDIGGEQAAVRRRAPLEELQLSPARKELTDRLIDARFLSTDRQGDFIFASLTHEALLRRWQHLSDWVSTNRDYLRMRAAIEQSQERWEEQNYEKSLLLSSGLPLEEGRKLLLQASGILSTGTTSYIHKSEDHHQTLARRKRKVRRATFAAMCALTGLALIGGIFALQQWSISKTTNLQLVKNNADLESAKNSLTTTNTDLESTQRNLKQALDRADQAALLTRRGQARQFTARAWRKLDERDPAGCFSLLGQALRLSIGDPEVEPLARARFCQLWQQFPIRGFWKDALAAAYSPSGDEFVLGEMSGMISIWDTETAQLKRNLDGWNSPVLHISYSDDGAKLVSSHFDGAVVVWDVVEGHRLREQRIPYEGLDGADASARVAVQQSWMVENGGIASLTAAGEVFLAEDSDKEFVRAPDRIGKVHEFSSDRKLILAETAEDQVQAFRVGAWQPEGNPQRHTASTTARFSPDGRAIATIDGQVVLVAMLDSNSSDHPTRCELGREVTSFDFGPDSRTLVSVSSSPDQQSEIRIWNVEDASSRVAATSYDKVTAAYLSPSGNELVLSERLRPGNDAAHTFQIRIWNVRQSILVATIPVLSDRVRVHFGATDSLLLTTSGSMASATLWSYADLSSPGYASLPIDASSHVGSTFDNVPGDYIVLNEDGILRWNLKSKMIEREAHRPLERFRVTSNVLKYETRVRTVTTLVETGHLLQSDQEFTVLVPVQEERELSSFSFLRDRIKSRHESQNLSIEDIEGIDIPGIYDFVGSLRSTYVLNRDRQQPNLARVWSISTSAPVTPPLVGPGRVVGGTFSRDGRFVAVVFEANILTLISSDYPFAHDRLAVDRDHNEVRRLVRIWDLRDGQPLTLLLLHHGTFEEFSDDGRYFVMVGKKEIRAFDLHSSSRCPDSFQAICLSQVVSQRVLDSAGELSNWNAEQVEADFASAREFEITGTPEQQLVRRQQEAIWCADHAWVRNNKALAVLAGKHARHLLKDDSSDIDAWLMSADAYAWDGDYGSALEDFERLLTIDARGLEVWDDFEIWVGAALLNLQASNQSRYSELCRQALEKFGQEKDVHLIDELVWLHTLAEGAHLNTGKLDALAEWLCEQHPNEIVHENTKFAVKYRAHSSEDALAWQKLRSANQIPGHELGAGVMFQLASFKTASTDEDRATAKRNLADIAARLKGGGTTMRWFERVETEILLNEASRLVGEFGPGSIAVPWYESAPTAPVAEPAPAPPAPAAG